MEFTLLETTIKLVVETEEGQTAGEPMFRIEVNDFADVDPDAAFLATIFRKAADELDLTNPQIQRNLEVVPVEQPKLSLVQSLEGLPE